MNSEPVVVTLNGDRYPLPVRPERLVNAGWTGRDAAAVQAHIDELEEEGVSPPDTVPALYPKPRHALTSSTSVQVLSEHTSGEVEFVLLPGSDDTYVTVGSDHTDREREAESVLLSKAVCPNVIGDTFWKLSDIRDHWDDLILRSRTGPPDEHSRYQEAPVSEILPPDKLLELFDERTADPRRGTALFSGSIGTLSGELRKESYFMAELHDPVLDRSLSIEYVTEVLDSRDRL